MITKFDKYTKLNENVNITGSNFIVVDIQPEYEDGFTFDIYDFIEFLNENYDNMDSLTFLFNGPDLGFPSMEELQWWYIENGLNEEIVNNSEWYDKGYAFFRYCIDSNIDEENIITLIKFMIKHDINDSRDIDEEMWDTFISETDLDVSEVRELLETSSDMINIPDLMEFLSDYNDNIVLCGGGMYECLKEVELALDALDKDYEFYNEFVY